MRDRRVSAATAGDLETADRLASRSSAVGQPATPITREAKRASTRSWLALLASVALVVGACGGDSKPGDAGESDLGADADAADSDDGSVPDSDADSGDTDPFCPGSTLECDGECIDPLIDEDHCGTCATQCAPGDECVGGMCGCPEGEQRCGFSCVNTQNDNDHCGQCDRVCGAEEVCSMGDCVTTCDEGLVNCGGDCIDITSDDDHCGRCDQLCRGDANEEATCEASVCLVGCIDGFYDLDGSPGCEYACPVDAPTDEVCDGIDNDCDGLTDADDPDMAAPLCVRQEGVCAGAVAACAGGAPVTCEDADYVAHNAAYVAGDELSCDGDDNDCDGDVDEGCCTTDLVTLEAVDDAEAIDVTVFQTYNLFDGDDSVTVATFAPVASLYPELDFGLLESGFDARTLQLLTVPGEEAVGSAISVEQLDEQLRWWVSSEVGVQTGLTDRLAQSEDLFVRLLAGQLRGTPFSGVQRAKVGDETFMVGLNRRAGDLSPRLRAILLNDDTTAGPEDWEMDITPASDGLAAWGTSDRFIVCATSLVETRETIHCYALDTDLELITDFPFADLPDHDQIRPFASRPDGSASIYGVDTPVACGTPCPADILELVVRPDGSAAPRNLGITALDGVMDVYAGLEEHWVFAKQEDDEAASGTVMALYRVTADDVTQVARFEGAANDRVVGVLVRDGFPHVVMPVPNAALDNPAMVVVPLSREGAPFCPEGSD